VTITQFDKNDQSSVIIITDNGDEKKISLPKITFLIFFAMIMKQKVKNQYPVEIEQVANNYL